MPVKKKQARDYVEAAMREYGTYVIEDRAVPDVRDGLKPVARRVLWSMHRQRFDHKSNFKKSARVVGDVIGKYHPHGSQAVYMAMAKMSQEFNVRYPLIQGHGNFGSPVNDQVAAERYTEVRLTKLAAKLFECIDVADLVPNYDGDDQEPTVIPTRLPLLLLNGGTGIAYGTSTSLPPHNIGEVVKALRYVIRCRSKNQDPDVERVIKLIKGPDYACGGFLISDRKDVEQLYRCGKGTLHYRCRYEFEQGPGHGLLVITGFAPGFSYKSFAEVVDKKFVAENRVLFMANESAKNLRVVIGFEDPATVPDLVKLLSPTVSYRFNVLHDKHLNSCNLLDLITDYVDFQADTETKMLRLETSHLEEQLDKERAKQIAVKNWKVFVKILSRSRSKDGMLSALCDQLELNRDQAQYLLTVPVGSLASYNVEDLRSRIKDLRSRIKELTRQLSDIWSVLLNRMDGLRPFLDERRTEIGDGNSSSQDLELGERWIGITRSGVFGTWKKPPRNEARFDFLTSSRDFVTVVDEKGGAQVFRVSEIKRGKSGIKNKVVGLVPGKCRKLIGIENRSLKYVAVDHPQKTDSYQLMKTENGLRTAFGVSERDTVVAFHELEVMTLNLDQITTTRKAVKSRRFMNGRRRYTTLLLPKNSVAVNERGQVLDYADLPGSRVLVLTASCLCRTDSGKHVVRTRDQLIKELKAGTYNYQSVFNL